MVKLTALLVILFCCAGAASVAAEDPVRIDVRNVDASQYPSIQIRFVAVDAAGFYLRNVTPSEIKVTAGGHTIPVTSLQETVEAELGISALLVIDSSGSMAGQPIEAAREAARSFLGFLRPADEIGVLTFSDSVAIVSDFTSNFEAANRSLDAVAARGNTALYQAVVQASNAISGRTASRKAIVLVSDGADFGSVSRVSRQRSLEAAKDAGAEFYVVGFGDSIDRPYLEELTASSNGRLYIAPSAGELTRAFGEIARVVRTEYAVTLDLTNLPLYGETKLMLTVEARGQRELSVKLPPLIPREIAPVEPAVSSGGGGSFLLLVAIGVALASLGAVAVLAKRFLERRQERQWTLPPPIFDSQLSNAVIRGASSEALACFVLPNGERLSLPAALTTLGVDAESTLRLPLSAEEFGQGNIRVWLANERFLLHDTAIRSRIQLNGRPIQWAFLSTGDELRIGSLRMQFERLKDKVESISGGKT